VTGDPVVLGFVEQSRQVCVAVDAALRRALTEGWSMVLEGVHLVPGLVPSTLEGAILVHVVVGISDEEVHRLHFRVRDSATGGVRAMGKYVDKIGDIRRIQSYIRSRAEREGVPVVENVNVERTIDEVVGLVIDS
jgi:2-phosphoglycerate kinase